MDVWYKEWLPDAVGLDGVVTAYWRVSGYGSNVPASAILPDGHVELVFNLGDPVGLVGPAYTGDQPDRAVVGLLSKALRLEYRGPVNTFGIRFHAARGAGFFGKPATELTDRLLPLLEVCAGLDRALAQLLVDHTNTEADACRAALDRVLLDHLPSALPPDTPVIAVVDRLTRSDVMPPVSQIAQEAGMSSRQLQRRFLAAVGVPPKRFVRTLRFARVWQLASMRPREAWASLAAGHGYADQAHLVREFRAFGAEPPTHCFHSGLVRCDRVVAGLGARGGCPIRSRSVLYAQAMIAVMKRVTLFKLYVNDQDAALRFYVDQLGFELGEDKQLGDYRWLLVRAPDNQEFPSMSSWPERMKRRLWLDSKPRDSLSSASAPTIANGTTRNSSCAGCDSTASRRPCPTEPA